MEYTNYLQATDFNQELCSTIAMEECGELIQAISKAKRGKLDEENLAEEIADVFIAINWIMEIYDIDMTEVEKWRQFKINRILNRLNNNNFD